MISNVHEIISSLTSSLYAEASPPVELDVAICAALDSRLHCIAAVAYLPSSPQLHSFAE